MLRRPRHLLIVLAAVPLVACGSSAKSSQTATETETQTSVPSASLSHAILARCAPPGFGQPLTTRYTSHVGKSLLEGWEVVYSLPKRTSPTSPKTSTVLIVENPTVLPRGFVKGGHDRVVAGHVVSFFVRPGQVHGFVARWKTSSAVYVALANGTQTGVLDRFIGCMP